MALQSAVNPRCIGQRRSAYDLLTGPWDDTAWARRCMRLKATLEIFVEGKQLGVCLTPYKAAKAYMGRLDKPCDEVWDVRAIDPKPGIRVFGRFAKKDVFVGLNWAPRSVEIPAVDRLALGPKDSNEWRNAIRTCKAEWRKLFPAYEPIHGDEINDYIGSNFLSV